MGGSGGARTLGWDRPGASWSPPAHVTAPKYPTHFLPNRTLTLQAGTRKIFSFFFSLPTPPPPSQPGSLLPLPPSLLPTLPPAPARLPPRCPGAGGRGTGRGGPGRLGLCPSHLLGFRGSVPGRPGKAGRRGQCPGPMMPPFLSGTFPLPAICGGGGGGGYWLSPLAGLWFPEASLCTSSGQAVRAVSTSSQGWLDRAGIRQSRSHYLHPALSLHLRVKVDSSSPCLPQPVLRSQEQTGLTSGGCRGSEAWV